MDLTDVDLVVIGGGAGGMSAARTGVRRGKRTVLVQDGPIGGDCTFTGCVPSKALIAAARRPGTDFAAALAAVRSAVTAIAATEDAGVFRDEGVVVVEGRARFVSRNEVEVDGRRIGAGRFVVATGSAPVVPPVEGLRDLRPLTSDTIWDLPSLPGRLAVLGGGAIGCELAQAFRRLGADVTLVEAEERVLAKDEPEVGEVVQRVFEREGIVLRLGSEVVKAELLDIRGATSGAARLHLEHGEPVEADAVLVAIGRRAVTEGLDLEAAGVEVDERGHVRTDDFLRTTAGNVWAVGDVTGRLPLTHAADEMGRIAVGNAFGSFRQRRFRAERVPRVTFTDPEVATVGMGEDEAAGHGGRVAHLPLTEVDRAVAEGVGDGFLKVIAGPRFLAGNLAGGRILGATIVSPRAGELIAELALAMRTGMFPARLALTTHAYPTWSMAVQKVVGQLFLEIEGRRARPAVRTGG